MDTNASFEGVDPENSKAASFPEDSKVGQLFDKILERQIEIDKQKKQIMSIMDSENASLKSQAAKMGALAQLAEQNAQDFGKVDEQEGHEKAITEDFYQQQKEFKVERQR